MVRILKKWIDYEYFATNSDLCYINMILMHYADILLMYEKPKKELNEEDESVCDAINVVRQRLNVNMPAITE